MTGYPRTLVSASIALSLVLGGFLALVPPARAAPPPPHNFEGIAYDDVGVVLPGGQRISAWVDGVDYSNDTLTSGAGYFDLDVFGNWYTNASNPNTLEVKEGADDADNVMFVWGDLTTMPGTGFWGIFTSSQNWNVGAVTNISPLTKATTQPNLLKISCITLRPVTGFQYAWVHNPSAAPVNFADYYLKKDGVGNTSYNAWQFPLSGIVQPNWAGYFDFGANRLNATGDDLELVWENPAGTAFGGQDVVIDRVEWNQTGGGTHNWEASNTTMPDAALVAADRAIERFPTNATDTNDNSVDFQAVPLQQECGRLGNNLPVITITDPTGADRWTGGTNHDILWGVTDTDNPNPVTWWINYTIDGGASYPLIATTSGTLGLGKTQAWNPIPTPGLDVTNARVRICVWDQVVVTCQSSSPFTIDVTDPVGTPSPAHGFSNVPTNVAISVTFNESMNSGVTMSDVTFVPPLTSPSLSWANNQTLNIGYAGLLTDLTEYTWTLSCNFLDASNTGNPLAGCPKSWTFNTTPPGDNPPTVNILSPTGGTDTWSGGLAGNSVIWDMTDDFNTMLSWTIDFAPDGSGWVPIGSSPADPVSPPSMNFPWTPPAGPGNTNPTIRVCADDGIVGHIPTCPTRQFAIDSIPPTAFETPVTGATSQSTSVPVRISFDENMDNTYLLQPSDVTFIPAVTGVIPSWNGMTIEVAHDTLATGTDYQWYLSCNITDQSRPGHPYAGCDDGTPVAWTFRTFGGSTLPSVSDLRVDNENTAPDKDHILPAATPPWPTFSWTYTAGSGGGQTQFAWTVTGFPEHNETSSLTTSDFDQGTLARGTCYDLTLRVKDSGRWSNPATLNFCVNRLPGIPTLTTPANTVTPPIQPGTVNFAWTAVPPDGTDTITYEFCLSLTSGTCGVAIVPGLATTTNTASTLGSSTYFWRVRAFDQYENDSWSAESTFSTTANTAPTVTVTTPAGGEVWTGGTAHPVVWSYTDNSPLADLWFFVNYTSSAGPGTIASVQGAVSVTPSWTTPSINAANVVVHIDIVDPDGARSADDSLPFAIDSTPPSVVSSPADQDTGVRPDAAIILTFSEAMDTTATESAILLAGSPGVGLLTPVWTNGNRVLTLNHLLDFGPTATYTLTISAVATDASDPGNALPATTIVFTTGVDDDTNPTADITGPSATIQADVEVTFSGSGSSDNPGGSGIDPSSYRWTVTDATGREIGNGTGVTFDFTFPSSGTYTVTLTVRDNAGLSDSDTYRVTIAGPVSDFPWWLLILILAAVIGAILFFVIAKRRKKDEEEMPPPPPAGAPPPPPPGEAPPPPGAAPPPPPRAPPPPPPMAAAAPPPPAAEAAATKECPSCGTIVAAGDADCFMCGTKL